MARDLSGYRAPSPAEKGAKLGVKGAKSATFADRGKLSARGRNAAPSKRGAAPRGKGGGAGGKES